MGGLWVLGGHLPFRVTPVIMRRAVLPNPKNAGGSYSCIWLQGRSLDIKQSLEEKKKKQRHGTPRRSSERKLKGSSGRHPVASWPSAGLASSDACPPTSAGITWHSRLPPSSLGTLGHQV